MEELLQKLARVEEVEVVGLGEKLFKVIQEHLSESMVSVDIHKLTIELLGPLVHLLDAMRRTEMATNHCDLDFEFRRDLGEKLVELMALAAYKGLIEDVSE